MNRSHFSVLRSSSQEWLGAFCFSLRSGFCRRFGSLLCGLCRDFRLRRHVRGLGVSLGGTGPPMISFTRGWYARAIALNTRSAAAIAREMKNTPSTIAVSGMGMPFETRSTSGGMCPPNDSTPVMTATIPKIAAQYSMAYPFLKAVRGAPQELCYLNNSMFNIKSQYPWGGSVRLFCVCPRQESNLDSRVRSAKFSLVMEMSSLNNALFYSGSGGRGAISSRQG